LLWQTLFIGLFMKSQVYKFLLSFVSSDAACGQTSD